MAKRAAKKQVSIALVADQTELTLRRAMKKVREIYVLAEVLELHAESRLTSDELAALEAVVTAHLREVDERADANSDHNALVACWLREYEAANGEKAPRLTEREANRIDDLTKQITGADRLERACNLIRAFWPWRASVIESGAFAPQASTFGLLKNLPSVTAFLGTLKKKTGVSGKQTAREIEQAQQEALASPPDPEQVKRFVEGFKTGRSNRLAVSGADDARPSFEPGAGGSAADAGSSS